MCIRDSPPTHQHQHALVSKQAGSFPRGPTLSRDVSQTYSGYSGLQLPEHCAEALEHNLVLARDRIGRVRRSNVQAPEHEQLRRGGLGDGNSPHGEKGEQRGAS
eukprot:713626-Prymnesium_polylepis.3